MSKIDRMVSAIDPAAGSAEPAVSRGVHDLLEEIVATQPQRGRSPLRRRLLAGAAVTGTAAAALIIIPLATGAENPAYAVTRQPDGSIHVKINEFRDPESLERDLAELGVKAQIWFTPPGKMCSRNFTSADPDVALEELNSPDPEVLAAARQKLANSPSRQAFTMEPKGGVRIFPDRIKQGQTAVMEFIEASGQTSGPAKPQVLWSFSFQLANGPVGECVLTDNPGWGDIGDPEKNPEAFPPPGS
ncbi:hypothetical protein [Acrocarpospora catenulata]|uniref:hypothetical protein n=1 Tax=Acrocarpospora catenulata TaxID=2836182 RepID=UPI001BDB500C|nr:hypothetical protein [Acrocarpospora catenulata]